MKTNDMLKSGGIIIAMMAILIGLWQLSTRLSPDALVQTDGPFALDLDSLGEVDPALRTWRESGRIALDLEILFGLAVKGDVVYVTGDQYLLEFVDGRERARHELGGEAFCLDIAKNGEIYLGMDNHIEVRNPDGTLKATWQTPDPRTLITAIAVAESGVYCADAGKRVVYRHDFDGNIVLHIGGPDDETGYAGFSIPSPYFDLAIGYEGYLWAVDPGKHLIKNFLPDGSLRSSWGKTSPAIDGFCGCCNPTNIAIFPDGSFVTSEKGLNRIKVYAPTGDLTSVVAAPDQFSQGSVGLDLGIDSRGRILVLDPKTKVIRIFTNAAKPQTKLGSELSPVSSEGM